MDELAKSMNITIEKEKFLGKVGEISYQGEKILLVKPQTFMNLSGDCVSSVLHFYKLSSKDLIVVYDDIDIPLGNIRVRPCGSAGTHNGMRDITAKIASEDFIRVRVGTGKPMGEKALYEYVLEPFSKEEELKAYEAIKMAQEAILEIIGQGVSKAMNDFNTKK